MKVTKLDCPHSDKKEVEMDKLSYASLCGSLMYAMIATHPYIAFAVGVVRKYMSNFGKMQWGEMKGTMRYLRYRNCMYICYGSQDPIFRVYTNLDYARDLDKRRSMSHYFFT